MGWIVVILLICIFGGLNPFAGLNLTPLEILGWMAACAFFAVFRGIFGLCKDEFLLWWREFKRVAPANGTSGGNSRREHVLSGEILPPDPGTYHQPSRYIATQRGPQ
jgi:hypothetical protein